MNTIHEINISRDDGKFIISAEKRIRLGGWTVQAWLDGVQVPTEWFRPETMSIVVEKPEDVGIVVSRLLNGITE